MFKFSRGGMGFQPMPPPMEANKNLKIEYHHENLTGELMAGKCHSIPGQGDQGQLVLKENWQWLTGDQSSGYSEVEEIIP